MELEAKWTRGFASQRRSPLMNFSPDLVLWSITLRLYHSNLGGGPVEAYEPNSLRYAELAANAEQCGHEVKICWVEVGCRGFVGTSNTRLLTYFLLLFLFPSIRMRDVSEAPLVAVDFNDCKQVSVDGRLICNTDTLSLAVSQTERLAASSLLFKRYRGK